MTTPAPTGFEDMADIPFNAFPGLNCVRSHRSAVDRTSRFEDDTLLASAVLQEVVMVRGADGLMTKRLCLVVRKLIERAEGGDITAIKEITDRIDGKPAQSVALSGGEEAEPIRTITRIIVDPGLAVPRVT